MSEPQGPIDPVTGERNTEKEIISLRDELQDGLLKQRPKGNDMNHISNCLNELEKYPN